MKEQNYKWFRQHPTKAIVLFIITFITLSIFIAELSLRLSGYQAGLIHKYLFFTKVDNLKVLKGYEADSNGIMKVNHEIKEFLKKELDPNHSITFIDKISYHWSDYCGELIHLIEEYDAFNHQSVNNDFQQYIQSLKEKNKDQLTEVDNAYLKYPHDPINADGFRSIAFKRYKTNKKTVLLLGDSFTWGSDSENITNTYADILSAKGYVVFNTGIVGTDPAQYLAIAKKYIPQLKPDIVIVNFFVGNDIMLVKRPTLPHQLVFYSTNAGNLLAFHHGIYLKTPQETYDYILSDVRIPHQEDKKLNKLCAKSVLGTRVWVLLKDKNIIPFERDTSYDYITRQALRIVDNKPVSNYYLKKIEQLSDEHNATFFVAVIPEVKELHLRIPEDYNGLFDDVQIHVPENITAADYGDDEHFNREGNRKYADFILTLIESKSFPENIPK